jgi:hypothetical protein
MGCEIFVGSSSEAIDHAREVSEILSRQAGTTALLWDTIFTPGLVTFEALEAMLRRCCGAVFIVTGDDKAQFRNQTVQLPRANIMLEFGLVAGRMGRENVALCQYGGVLPSDLKGMTVILMEPVAESIRTVAVEYSGNAATGSVRETFRQLAEKKLASWSGTLLTTANRIPRTQIVHGYTGRWEFEIELSKWRSLPVAPPSQVVVTGNFDLFMPTHGQTGTGHVQGDLTFEYYENRSASASMVYEGGYRITHEIKIASTAKDGLLSLTTQGFTMGVPNGNLPPALSHLHVDPWTATWALSSHPDETHQLRGEFRMHDTEGTVMARKMEACECE